MINYASYVPETAVSDFLLKKIKEAAAYCTDEEWRYFVFYSLKEMELWVKQQGYIHLVSWDVTGQGAVSSLERFRREQADSMLLVIADENMSPRVYLRPSILPSALLLKPISEKEADEALKEFFDAFLQKFYGNAAEKMFVAETRDDRIQIPYAQIDYFEAREKKVFVRAGREEYGFYASLSVLSRDLPEYFVQCHRSFLANMKHFRKMDKMNGLLRTERGIAIPYSRSFKRQVEAYWNGK